jgi:hypothetical protein
MSDRDLEHAASHALERLGGIGLAASRSFRQRRRDIDLGAPRKILEILEGSFKPRDDNQADDVAAVVLNNMKTMVGMASKEAPTSLGAPDELRLMNRLYLAAKLGTGAPRKRKKSGN